MIDAGFYCMDCFDGMAQIDDKSIDMILCDLPYGTTQCSWDVIIPFEPLWDEYKRIIKDNGAIVLFSAQPFTTDLIESNRKMFRYEIIWKKTTPSGFLNAKKMPMRIHENILVFYKKAPTYNPQMRKSEKTILLDAQDITVEMQANTMSLEKTIMNILKPDTDIRLT